MKKDVMNEQVKFIRKLNGKDFELERSGILSKSLRADKKELYPHIKGPGFLPPLAAQHIESSTTGIKDKLEDPKENCRS
jgi:hypothetical protein